MGRKSFKDIVLCVTEDMPEKHEKIRQWVEYHGGRLEKTVTKEVTHLLASRKAWTKGHELVKKAQKQPYRTHIVNYDWLEDSLMSPNHQPKSCTKYLWSRTQPKKRQRTLDTDFKREGKIEERLMQFDQECEILARELGQDGYHLFTDPTNFTFSITLARPNLLNNKIDRYHIKVRNHSNKDCPIPVPVYYFTSTQKRPIIILPNTDTTIASRRRKYIRVPPVKPLAQQIQLVESDSLPPTYGLYIRYVVHPPPSTLATTTTKSLNLQDPNFSIDPVKVGTDLLAPLGSEFSTTFAAFRTFFKLKTGIEWEQRLTNLRGPEQRRNGERTFEVDGETGAKTSEWFRYVPPLGQNDPKGLFPGEVSVIVPNGMVEGERDGEGGKEEIRVDGEGKEGWRGKMARTPEGGW